MSQSLLEKLAVMTSVAVIVGGIWFWILMIGNVLDTLRLAYG
jgi:hypothetical protein